MNKVARYSIISILGLPFTAIIVVLVIVVACYVFSFAPYKQNIDQIVKNAGPKHVKPPKELRLMANLVGLNSNQHLLYVARVLAWNSSPHPQRAIWWTCKLWLWEQYLRMNYSDKTIFTLWCELLWHDNIKGLSSISVHLFGRDLDKLTKDEIATLVALIRYPALSDDKSSIEDQKSRILREYHEQSGEKKKDRIRGRPFCST